MIICGESLGHLGKNEAKILVGSDSVLSVDKKWDLLRISWITFKAKMVNVENIWVRLKQKFHWGLRGLSQITFALGVGRWSEKCVVYNIKSAI